VHRVDRDAGRIARQSEDDLHTVVGILGLVRNGLLGQPMLVIPCDFVVPMRSDGPRPGFRQEMCVDCVTRVRVQHEGTGESGQQHQCAKQHERRTGRDSDAARGSLARCHALAN
jgi:hypothetical protein